MSVNSLFLLNQDLFKKSLGYNNNNRCCSSFFIVDYEQEAILTISKR